MEVAPAGGPGRLRGGARRLVPQGSDGNPPRRAHGRRQRRRERGRSDHQPLRGGGVPSRGGDLARSLPARDTRPARLRRRRGGTRLRRRAAPAQRASRTAAARDAVSRPHRHAHRARGRAAPRRGGGVPDIACTHLDSVAPWSAFRRCPSRRPSWPRSCRSACSSSPRPDAMVCCWRVNSSGRAKLATNEPAAAPCPGNLTLLYGDKRRVSRMNTTRCPLASSSVAPTSDPRSSREPRRQPLGTPASVRFDSGSGVLLGQLGRREPPRAPPGPVGG
jgi:hypothetical protein